MLDEPSNDTSFNSLRWIYRSVKIVWTKNPIWVYSPPLPLKRGRNKNVHLKIEHIRPLLLKLVLLGLARLPLIQSFKALRTVLSETAAKIFVLNFILKSSKKLLPLVIHLIKRSALLSFEFKSKKIKFFSALSSFG